MPAAGGRDLEPYPSLLRHGSALSHAEIRARLRQRRDAENGQEKDGKDSPIEVQGPFTHLTPAGSHADERPIMRRIGVDTRVITVPDPLRYVSVYEPGGPGGCGLSGSNFGSKDGGGRGGMGGGGGKARLATVRETAAAQSCLFSVNAGFFNTTSGACMGNIVSDGHIVQKTSYQNANLGIREDGSLVTGYLSTEMIAASTLPKSGVVSSGAGNMSSSSSSSSSSSALFAQLVTGAVWLVRDGKNYVSQSVDLEDSAIESTGTLYQFAQVKAARTAVGFTATGQLILLQVDGETWVRGKTLWEMADMLIAEGVVNGINLDGGGSSTSVVNHTLVSFPTDHCLAEGCDCPLNNVTLCADYCKAYRCERPVSTIICVHEPLCNNRLGCGSHGTCHDGNCECDEGWTGVFCDERTCNGATGCGIHGTCTGSGTCNCHQGWQGGACELPECNNGMGCGAHGSCEAAAASAENGNKVLLPSCRCFTGFAGSSCEQVDDSIVSAGYRLATILLSLYIAISFIICGGRNILASRRRHRGIGSKSVYGRVGYRTSTSFGDVDGIGFDGSEGLLFDDELAMMEADQESAFTDYLQNSAGGSAAATGRYDVGGTGSGRASPGANQLTAL
eukprot:UC1_evm1s2053